MNLEDPRLKDILLQQGYVTPEDVQKAEEISAAHHISIVESLITENIITKDLAGQAIAEFYTIPFSDISSNTPAHDVITQIPEQLAKKHRVVLMSENDKEATIATDDPTRTDLVTQLQPLFEGKQIVTTYALPDEIETIFLHYRKPLETRFSSILKSQKRIAPEIIDEIISDAVVFRASDIHFEPLEHDVIIRFRIDGILHEAGRIPKEYYENIVNRIKIQAHLRIDDHFSAQDGATRFEREGAISDLRVSLIPTLDGEKIVIRILSEYVRSFSLTDLGLSSRDRDIFVKTAQKPFGMILVSGPTGSGKTTTLYGLLKILADPRVNITTIEDPVEYRVAGINQIQVNTQTNLTFSQGLRSIVRQDPDIILVGEIRDTETAEIAVNAALTGHLLLSTFHANDAATSVPRLLDMGIEPFLLSSTLELIVSQRLIRTICRTCRVSISQPVKDIDPSIPHIEHYFPERTVTLYQGKGCEVCNHTGYVGRTAIYEIIPMTREMRELVLHNPSSQDVWKLARVQGAHSMFEDGIEKVRAGLTTVEEILRVAEPQE